MASLAIWARGYCRSRGYADPAPGPAGLWMQIGLPEQVGRHVPTQAFDPDAYRRLVASVAGPHVYVEAMAPRDEVLALMPAGWTPRDSHWLMTLPLKAGDTPPLPAGYAQRLIETDGLCRVEIDAPDGSLAASGNCGLGGAYGTFDKIVTDEAHRRRGLGSVIMQALTTAALARGVTEGILIATPDGQALYRALGWSDLGEVVSVISG